MRAIIHTNHKEPELFAGFKAIGYDVTKDNGLMERRDDVLVVWNTTSRNKPTIDRYKRAGARVLVAENGYIGSDHNGNRLIALALDKHLGLGTWRVGQTSRLEQQNITLKPWKKDGENIVILAQRGIGLAPDLTWAREAAAKIRQNTKRPVIIREHKGKLNTPIEPVFDNAFCCVTHSSGAAVKALAYGIPVFYGLEGWIAADCAKYGLDVKNPVYPDREETFRRLSWAQWSRDEIASGDALRWIL